MRTPRPRPAPQADDPPPRHRNVRTAQTRTRSTDGWSLSNIIQIAIVVIGAGGAVLGAYLSLQARLAGHDTDIAGLRIRIDGEQQTMSEVRGSLSTISAQISDLRTALAVRGGKR